MLLLLSNVYAPNSGYSVRHKEWNRYSFSLPPRDAYPRLFLLERGALRVSKNGELGSRSCLYNAQDGISRAHGNWACKVLDAIGSAEVPSNNPPSSKLDQFYSDRDLAPCWS